MHIYTITSYQFDYHHAHLLFINIYSKPATYTQCTPSIIILEFKLHINHVTTVWTLLLMQSIQSCSRHNHTTKYSQFHNFKPTFP